MNKNRFLLITLFLVFFIIGATSCNKDKKGGATLAPVSDEAFVDVDSDEDLPYEKINMKIGILRDSSAIGMAQLMKNTKDGTSSNLYEFIVADSIDEINEALANGKLDAAVVPCNTASVLYNKNNGNIQTAAAVDRGNIYILNNTDCVNSITDLKGKTVYVYGKGGTSQVLLRYLLKKNEINPDTDVTIVSKDSTDEIITLLNDTEETIAVLPEPFVTLAVTSNEAIRKPVNLNDLWGATNENTVIVSNVLVARKEFIDANMPSFDTFLNEYAQSVEYAVASVDNTASILESFELLKDISNVECLSECNIEYFESDAMQEKIEAYLKVLYSFDSSSVGGAMPEAEFYYVHNVG